MPPSSSDPVRTRRAPAGSSSRSISCERRSATVSTADTEEQADFNFLFVPGRILVDRAAYDAAVETRAADAPALPELGTQEDSRRWVTASSPGSLPERTDSRRQDVLEALQAYDTELGKNIVTPEHYVHVAAIGNGRSCPATEPEETGRSAAWPPRNSDTSAGKGVHVHVIDTGWMPASRDVTGDRCPRTPGTGRSPRRWSRAERPALESRTASTRCREERSSRPTWPTAFVT